jgi:hypothetical protein
MGNEKELQTHRIAKAKGSPSCLPATAHTSIVRANLLTIKRESGMKGWTSQKIFTMTARYVNTLNLLNI